MLTLVRVLMRMLALAWLPGVSSAGLGLGLDGHSSGANGRLPLSSRRSLMLTLVHAPRSRSSAFVWLLEEAGEPYRIQYVSIRRGDGSGSLDASNPHPHGKVPVLIDGATVIFEQSAIALYIADKYPQAGLGP